jgi:hypothetical protein
MVPLRYNIRECECTGGCSMTLPAQKHVYEQEFALSREKVWELLSNTDHLNRVIGLFPIRMSSFHFQNTDFFRELSAKVAGVVPMRWKEHPFQWVKNERYDVVRDVLRLPPHRKSNRSNLVKRVEFECHWAS